MRTCVTPSSSTRGSSATWRNVFVEITLESQNHMHLENFEAAVLEIDEVVACHALTGRCDYLLHVVVQSLEHYDQILKAQLTQLPGVSHLESHPALHQVGAEG